MSSLGDTYLLCLQINVIQITIPHGNGKYRSKYHENSNKNGIALISKHQRPFHKDHR